MRCEVSDTGIDLSQFLRGEILYTIWIGNNRSHCNYDGIESLNLGTAISRRAGLKINRITVSTELYLPGDEL